MQERAVTGRRRNASNFFSKNFFPPLSPCFPSAFPPRSLPPFLGLFRKNRGYLVVSKKAQNAPKGKKKNENCMLSTTLDVLKAGLKADPTVSAADRARLLALLRMGAAPDAPPPHPADVVPRILRRAEVAHRLAVSLRTVDKLPIKKIKLPGRTRAAGFLEADVNALLT